MIDATKNNSPLDLSYLRDMSGDSAEFIIEMIDMFKQQTPLYIEDLQQALLEKDWAKVASCAHKMKPTFSYVGREDAKEHMQLMEHSARDLNNIEELPKLFLEVQGFVEILYRQLDDAKESLEKEL
jgi:HPt (histidine-containing phosphotransfer) domain-containing protein